MGHRCPSIYGKSSICVPDIAAHLQYLNLFGCATGGLQEVHVAGGLHAAAELKVEELLERVGAAGLGKAAGELAKDPAEQLLGVHVALVGPLGSALQAKHR